MAKSATDNIAASLGGTVVTDDGVDVTTGVIVQKGPNTRLIENTRNIQSFDDALAALRLHGIEPETAADFELADDKGTLVGVPMVFLQWRFNTDAKGRVFVSIEAVTKDGRKVVINDGTKRGIRDQLLDLTEDRLSHGTGIAAAHAGLVANAGLRKSEYTEADGAAADGTSWYVQGLPLGKVR